MNAGTGILVAAGTVRAGDDWMETVAGGVMLVVVGLVVLAVGGSRLSRLGAAGLMLWGACLVVPAVAGMV
jgi:hypothetical protein